MTDEENEEAEFLKETRGEVVSYLDHTGIGYRSVSQEPDWFLVPHISIWSVFGAHGGDRPGWFAIAGNLPTDYVSSGDARDARSAMRHFSRLWLEAANDMAAGKPHSSFTIGEPKDWPDLSKLLRARALLLAEFADNEGLWPNSSTPTPRA